MDLEMTSSSRAIRPSAAYIPACMQSMETTGNSITDSRDSCCIISILQTRSVLRIKFRMTLDNMGWTGPRYDDYTSVAYWYQTLPSAPLMPLPTDAEMCMR